MRWE